MTTYLITGGAGFIGSHIAEALIAQNTGRVIAYDNLSSGKETNLAHLGARVSLIRGDVRNRDELTTAMAGVDIVFHEAAFVSAFDSYRQPALTNDINIGGTLNVLDAAAATDVKKVVLASSAAVYGTEAALPNREATTPAPASPYAITKICGEHYARMYARYRGLATVCLRYFNVFGPRQDASSEYSGVISRFSECIHAQRRPTIYGDGSQTRDFISVKDVARANIMAAMSATCGHGEAINIGTGKEITLLEVLHAIEHACATELGCEFKPWREGDIRRSVADVTLARELIGFSAEVEFAEGIAEMMGQNSEFRIQ